MKPWKKTVLTALVALAAGTCTETFAIDNMDYSPENPPGYENLWNRITRKLGRGISNVAFGALELPIRVYAVNFEEGGIAALTSGVLSGVGYVVWREVIGVVEIVTFPVPLPNCPNDKYDTGTGYGPIITPEWVITPETNYYNFVYPNTSLID